MVWADLSWVISNLQKWWTLPRSLVSKQPAFSSFIHVISTSPLAIVSMSSTWNAIHSPFWWTNTAWSEVVHTFQECFWVSGTTCARLSMSPSHSKWFVKITCGKQIRVWFEFFPWLRVKVNTVCMGCIWGVEWKNQCDFLIWFDLEPWETIQVRLGTMGKQVWVIHKLTCGQPCTCVWLALGCRYFSSASTHVQILLEENPQEDSWNFLFQISMKEHCPDTHPTNFDIFTCCNSE